MATTSTEDQNDPTLDNRAEYTPPPCAEELSNTVSFDADGFLDISEVTESDDTVAY